MTEKEWLEHAVPGDMLKFLGDGASRRKLWLFTCNCLEYVWGSLLEKDVPAPLEQAWAAADSPGNLHALAEADPNSEEVVRANITSELQEWFATRAFDAALRPPEKRALMTLRMRVEALAVVSAKDKNQDTAIASRMSRSAMATFLRDIFGNPFSPVTLDPSCRSSTVIALAQEMYDSRDFSAMPILADALEDAGLMDETILSHCRETTRHVRGCFVVDLCLCRE